MAGGEALADHRIAGGLWPLIRDGIGLSWRPECHGLVEHFPFFMAKETSAKLRQAARRMVEARNDGNLRD
jgi:hypothetical protein